MKLEIGIKNFDTEEITNHEVGFIWGFGAFEIFEDTTGLDQTAMHMGVLQGNQKVLCNLAYAAMQNWSDVVNGTTDLPFTYRQFQYWLSEADKGVASKVTDDFMKSAYEGGSMESYYVKILDLMNEGNDKDNKQTKKKRQSPSEKSSPQPTK